MSNIPPQFIGHGPKVAGQYIYQRENPAYAAYQQGQSVPAGQRDLLADGASPASDFGDFLRRGGTDDSSGRGPGLTQYQVDNFSGFDPDTGRPLGFFGPPLAQNARAFQFEHDAQVQAIRNRLGREADRFIQQGIYAQQSFRPGGSDPRLYAARAQTALQRANLVQNLDMGADARRHEAFLARQASSKAATNQIIGGVIQAGATVAGAAIGGPAGAAIGAGLGSAAAAGLTGGGSGQIASGLTQAAQGAATAASQPTQEDPQAQQTIEDTGTAMVSGGGDNQAVERAQTGPAGPQVDMNLPNLPQPQGPGQTQGGYYDDNGQFVPGPGPAGGTGGTPPGAPEGFGGAGGMAGATPPPSYGADGDFSGTALAAEAARNLGPLTGRIAAEVLAAHGDTFAGVMDMQIQNLLADSYARSAAV